MKTKITTFLFFLSSALLAQPADTSNVNVYGGRIQVYGGDVISIKDAPWQVLLSCGCGGTIIAPNIVLTAAHCVYNYKANDLIVYGGIDKWREQSNNNGNAVKNIYNHPDFIMDENTSPHDIAILELTKPLNTGMKNANGNSLIKVIPFATPSNTTDAMLAKGQKVTITGWGVHDDTGTGGINDLRRAVLEISDIQRPRFMTLNLTGLNKGNGLCDSGGPGVVTKDGTTIVVGVASSRSLSEPIRESHYTNVRAYSDWINKIIGCSNFAGNNVEIGVDSSPPESSCGYYVKNHVRGLTYHWESLSSRVRIIGDRGSRSIEVEVDASRTTKRQRRIFFRIKLTVSGLTPYGDRCSSSKIARGVLYPDDYEEDKGKGKPAKIMASGTNPEKQNKITAKENTDTERFKTYAYQFPPTINTYPNPAKGQSKVSILEKTEEESFATRSSENKKQETEWISSQDISPTGEIRLPEPATLILYDQYLQVRYKGQSQISPATLPLEDIPKGLYFLHINYKGNTRQQQLMVE